MKRFFQKTPVKVILSILLALVVIVAACNAVFAYVALQEQKGTAVCDAWSPEDTYQPDYAKSIDVGADDFKILCLTDIHIRNHGTFAAALGINFILDGMSRPQLKKLIKNEQPDLILVTGDIVLTAWNDISMQKFADFMDGFEIPWAPIYGNHDYEGRADKAKTSEILLNSKYSLFKSGPDGMGGMGNYILNLERDGKPVYSIFMFDNGQFRITDGEITTGGFNPNQVEWYQWAVKGIAKQAGKPVPNMAFMHVPVPEYKEIESGFSQGDRRENSSTAKQNDGFFEAFKANGGTHMFAGHDHNNNFITEYEGVSLGYVTKSSYNCYFTFDALGGNLLTLDQNNQVKVEIKEF